MRILLAYMVVFSAQTSPGNTQCTSDQGLSWVWPNDATVSVPANAVIWVVPKPDTEVIVELDGQTLSVRGSEGLDRFKYDPPPLDVGTQHNLVVVYGSGSTKKKTPLHSFVVSAPPLLEPPPAPVVTGHENVESEGACTSHYVDQVCSVSQDSLTHLRLQITAVVELWAVRTSLDQDRGPWVLWPGTCAMEVFMDANSVAAGACVEVMALDGAGNESETSAYCPFASGSADSQTGGSSGGDADVGGCAAGKGPRSGVLTMFFLALGLLRQRRYLSARR